MYYKLILNFFLGSGSGSIPSRCTDSSRNCRNWAIQGYCSYNLYTKTNCKKSCNLCRECLCNIHLFTFLIVNAKLCYLVSQRTWECTLNIGLEKTLSSTFKTPLFRYPERTMNISRCHWFPRTRTEIPYWWRVTAQVWLVLLIGWSKFSDNQTQNPDMGKTWVVSHHQYGISALIFQASFHGDTSGGVARCRLFSQVVILVLPKLFL